MSAPGEGPTTDQFYGRHLFGELYGLPSEILDDEERLAELLAEAVPLGGATLCGLQTKRFAPSGVTVLALLAESHASIHTYPSRGAMFVDIFTCGDCCPQRIADHLVAALAPERVDIRQIERGRLDLPLCR